MLHIHKLRFAGTVRQFRQWLRMVTARERSYQAAIALGRRLWGG